MLLKFSDAIMEKEPQLFEFVADSYRKRFVSYILNSEYRKAVELRPWIQEQVANPTDDLMGLANQIERGATHDETVRNILNWTILNVRYVSDDSKHKVVEYWQTAQQTFETKTGDCEDGAIFIYVLCHLKGIPANRLLLFCGDVFDPFTKKVAGHCWLTYRADNYPLNWAFMDWCYYPNRKDIENRNLYYVNKKTIFGYTHNDGAVTGYDTMYKTIWFAFNENKAHLELVYNREV